MFCLWILERVAISFAVFIAGACIGTLLPEEAADVVIRLAGFALPPLESFARRQGPARWQLATAAPSC